MTNSDAERPSPPLGAAAVNQHTAQDRTPGDLLVHPAVIVALVVVIVNDRVLKVRFPSEITGKLSDFAGLVFFPLFLVSIIEAVRWVVRRDQWELSQPAATMAIVLVGVPFSLIKTWHPAGEAYRSIMGAILWMLDAMTAGIRGDLVPDLYRVSLVEDRTDLIAIVALAVPLWVARRVMRPKASVT